MVNSLLDTYSGYCRPQTSLYIIDEMIKLNSD